MEKAEIKNETKSYKLPGIFFKKYWFWFADPFDVKKADKVDFFSYNKISFPGFYRKDSQTSIINLEQNLDQIWLKIRKKFTRDLINKGIKIGIIIKRDNNFKDFKKIYRNFRKRKKIHADKFAIFKNGILFSAYLGDKMIAGHIFIAERPYFRSWMTASIRLENIDGKEKRKIGCANRILVWEAMKYAKDSGFKIFDLGGINPNSSDKEELSLLEFKESFGGERRECFYYYKVYSKLLKFWMRLRGYKKV